MDLSLPKNRSETAALWMFGFAYGLLMGVMLGDGINGQVALAILAGIAWLVGVLLLFRKRPWVWLGHRIVGRNFAKLLTLEKDLSRLQAQIQRDFPGEIEVYHPYDYDEQHVLTTAGVLLGRYYAYRKSEKAECCPKSLDGVTFAPYRMPTKGAVVGVEG